MRYFYLTLNGVVKSIYLDALDFIDLDAWPDAIRFLRVIGDSGADDETCLAALYRWTRDREHYKAINEGLENYFEQLLKRVT